MFRLEPMTQSEYEHYTTELWEDYAAVRARNFQTTVEYERERAARQREELLPQERETPNHWFWNMVAETDGVAGHLWVHVRSEEHSAFIYDIEVLEAHRRKGYARSALAALEDFVRPLDVTRIALNVFGDNPGAQQLYQQVGYRAVAISMQKELS
jgi:GNAT superfamily N-acetyltransferase